MYKKALESEGCQAVHLTSIDEDFECDTFLEGFDQVLAHPLAMADHLHTISCLMCPGVLHLLVAGYLSPCQSGTSLGPEMPASELRQLSGMRPVHEELVMAA